MYFFLCYNNGVGREFSIFLLALLSFLVKDGSILSLYDLIACFFVKSICPLIPAWSVQIKLSGPREFLFYLQAKRTPSIGAFGYHRMDGDEFAPYLLS